MWWKANNKLDKCSVYQDIKKKQAQKRGDKAEKELEKCHSDSFLWKNSVKLSLQPQFSFVMSHIVSVFCKHRLRCVRCSKLDVILQWRNCISLLKNIEAPLFIDRIRFSQKEIIKRNNQHNHAQRKIGATWPWVKLYLI